MASRSAVADGPAAERTAENARIEISGLTKRYLTPGGDVFTALRDVTFTVEPGQFCAVVGPTRCRDLHITDTHYYDTIKYWQTPVKPTNYRQWTDVWGEVKG